MTAAETLCGSFSPFVVTVDGALGPRQYFCGALLRSCWLSGRGAMMRYWGGFRHNFLFLLLSGLLICIYGDHVVQCRSGVGIDDGAGLPDVMTVLN